MKYLSDVGINKAPENGDLDVDGDIYSNGEKVVTAGEWISWTPAWTNITVGNGVSSGHYTIVGKTVHFRVLFRRGSTSSVSDNPRFTLPVEAINYGETSTGNFPIGRASFEDNGTATVTGFVDLLSSTTARPLLYRVSGANVTNGAVTATTPFTWATGDEIMATGTYQTL